MAQETKQVNITIEAGADFQMFFTVRDDSDRLIDLTGATVEAQLREYAEASDYLEFTATHNGAGGRVSIYMAHEDTAAIPYSAGVYDVYITDADNNREKYLMGEVTVTPSITKPVAGEIIYLLSFASEDDFPSYGMVRRIYFSHATNHMYRWNGTDYVDIVTDGEAATVEVGEVETLSAGSDATVENVGSLLNAVLDFGIPEGNGIDEVTKTSSGLTDTYTISFTDPNAEDYSFDVTNGRGIVSVTKNSSGLTDTYTFTFNDSTTYQMVVKNGNGITSMVKSSSGLTDTYTITFADATTLDMVITNGKGVSSVTKTSEGLEDTYTVTWNDGTTTSYTVSNGRSIVSIEKTDSDDLVDEYTITFNDGDTFEYNVTNGMDCTHSWDGTVLTITSASGTSSADLQGTTDYEELENVPETFPPEEHDHNELYYGKSTVDSLLGTKADSSTVSALAVLVETKANANSVYNKSETDALLAFKANSADLGDLALKDTVDYETEVTNTPDLGALADHDTVDYETEITNIPETFPPSAHNHDSRYYTETEVDTALALKANSADVYNKTESDALLDGKLDAETAEFSGGIVTFESDTKHAIKDLTIDFKPVQDLHGYEHPWAGGEGKNLLENIETSATVKEVEFVVNADGTVTANGTATGGDATFQVHIDTIKISGDVKFVGTSGGSASTYDTIMWDSTANARCKKWDGTTNGESSYDGTFKEAKIVSGNTVVMTLRVFNNKTVENVTFTPMICASTETDSTFAPYGNVCPISGWTQGKVTRTGKNLLRMTLANLKSMNAVGTWNDNVYTRAGIDYTVLTDENDTVIGIEANGTATDNSYFMVENMDSAFAESILGKSVIINGCPNGANNNTYCLNVYINNSTSTQIYEKDAKYTYPNELTQHNCSIWVKNGYTISNAVFHPMVRYATVADATFEPYYGTSATVALGATYYGAWLEVTSGVLTVTDGYIASYDGEDLPSSWISDRDMYAEGTTPTTGAQVVYKLAESQTVQLTKQKIESLIGLNHLWTNTDFKVTLRFTNVYTKKETDTFLASKAPVITETQSGSVITFNDGSELPIQSLTVNIDPIQDLHGYDAPWAGGAGKNLLQMTLANLKAYNTVGTWSGNTYTRSDVAFTVLTDSDDNVIGINANGTASADTYFFVDGNTSAFGSIVAGQSVVINGCPDGASGSTYFINVYVNNSASTPVYETEVSYTYPETLTQHNCAVWVKSGYNIQNKVFQPMIRFSTEDDGTFEPYSNICSIDGWNEVTVTRAGKNLLPLTVNGIKQANSGNWIDNTITLNNVAFTILTDENDIVTGIHADGTASSISQLWLGSMQFRAGDSVNFSANVETDANVFFRIAGSGKGVFTINVPSYGASAYTFTSDSEIWGNLRVGSGEIVDKIFKPVVCWSTFSDTSFVPYYGNPVTIDLGETRYGGYLDVLSGILTVTDGYIAEYDGEELPSTWISDRDAYAEGATPTTGAQVVYKLSTPFTIQLVANQVYTLFGDNSIWASTRSCEVEYRADTKMFIENAVAEATRKTRQIIAGVEDAMKATQNYTAGQYLIVGDDLYKVTANIANGGTITVGTNVAKTTVAEQLILALS